MDQKLDIKNLKIRVSPEILDRMMASGVLSAEIPLSVIPGNIKIRPRFFNLILKDENQFEIRGDIPVEVIHPDWSVTALIDLFMFVEIPLHPFRRMDEDTVRIHKIELREKSEFLVDERPVRFVPTINEILDQFGSEIIPTVNKILENELRKFSEEYFGNDFLMRWLEEVYIQITSTPVSSGFDFSLSAASDLKTLKRPEEDTSSVYLGIPGNEFQYLLSHLPVPPISAAGYHMLIEKVEVTGYNQLRITLVDQNKGASIELTATLTSNKNILRIQVEELEVRGLGWMKSGLFKILRNTIIRQIEKKPVDLSSMYRSFIYDMSRKYPFLQIQENKELLLQKLEITPEYFSISIGFED